MISAPLDSQALRQPSVSAAPFVPGGTVKASAIPFVPGATSPFETQAVGQEVSLPSDDDFRQGLTDLSITPHDSGAQLSPELSSQHGNSAGNTGGVGSSPSPLKPHKCFLGAASCTTLRTKFAIHPGYSSTFEGIQQGEVPLASHFISDQLHTELKHRALLERSQLNPAHEIMMNLPQVRALAPAASAFLIFLYTSVPHN